MTIRTTLTALKQWRVTASGFQRYHRFNKESTTCRLMHTCQPNSARAIATEESSDTIHFASSSSSSPPAAAASITNQLRILLIGAPVSIL
jgi:hypothetical protein